MESDGDRPQSRTRELAMCGLHLLGLSGLAFAQPVYDLLRGDLSSLVATDATGAALVLLVLVIALGPPLVLFALEAVAFAISREVGRAVHLVFVAGLIALFVLQAHASIDDSGSLLIVLAPLFGVGGALAYRRFRTVRLGMTVLAPAPLIFAAVFLLSPAVAPLVSPDEPAAAAAEGRAAPVVVVVFDELPLTSLLDHNARIDAARYPAFARLARDGTWFPHTTSVDGGTPWAVPAILTGDRPDPQVLATGEAHPRSVFTLLGADHETHAIEPITRLCPHSVCERDDDAAPARAANAANLLSAATANRLLPDPLGPAALKGIRRVQGVLGANKAGDYLAAAVRRRRGDFRRFAASIRPGGRPGLWVLHVLLPHGPWELTPGGRRYSADLRGLDDDVWTRDETVVQLGWQRHLLQLEYTDRLLGSVLERLDRAGLYDDALVAVAADHGVNFTPGGHRRQVDVGSVFQLAPVPFILKAPRQRRAEINREPLETVDVLATIADALHRPLPWTTDGTSAFDPGRESPDKATMTDAGTHPSTVPRVLLPLRSKVLARRIQLFGDGHDPSALYTLGTGARLVGRPLGPGRLASLRSDKATIAGAGRFEDVDLQAPTVPEYVEGTLDHTEPGAELGIAVNGRFAAFTRSFRAGGSIRFAAPLPDWALREGANDVAVLDMRGEGSLARLP